MRGIHPRTRFPAQEFTNINVSLFLFFEYIQEEIYDLATEEYDAEL